MKFKRFEDKLEQQELSNREFEDTDKILRDYPGAYSRRFLNSVVSLRDPFRDRFLKMRLDGVSY